MAHVADVELSGIRLHSNWAEQGGGINLKGGSNMTMEDSSIFDNTACRGGGIKIWDCGLGPEFTHCAFVGNHAGIGKALHIDWSYPLPSFDNCLVDGHLDGEECDDGAAILLGAGINITPFRSWFATNDEISEGQGTITTCSGLGENFCEPYPGDWNGNGVDDWDEIVLGDVLDADQNWIPDGFEADNDGSTVVDHIDLITLLSVWGTQTWRYDIDGDEDNEIGTVDLLLLLQDWG